MIFGREPVLITNALLLIATAVWSLLSNDINIDFSSAQPYLLGALTAFMTWRARRKVASEHTVNKAGLTMEELVERAEDPNIPPAQPEGTYKPEAPPGPGRQRPTAWEPGDGE